MGKLTEKTWEQEMMEEVARQAARARELGQAEGRQQGQAEGRQQGELAGLRASLRIVLEQRFGALPEAWVQRLQAADSPDRIKAAMAQVLTIDSLDDLKL